MTKSVKSLMWYVIGLVFAAPSLFFAYYTVRLIYLNLTMADAAAHRTGGMLIGAIAFPLAAIIFGILSWLFFKRGFITK